MSLGEFRQLVKDLMTLRDGRPPVNDDVVTDTTLALAQFGAKGNYLTRDAFSDFFISKWADVTAQLSRESGEPRLPSPIEDVHLVDRIHQLHQAAPSGPVRRQSSYQGVRVSPSLLGLSPRVDQALGLGVGALAMSLGGNVGSAIGSVGSAVGGLWGSAGTGTETWMDDSMETDEAEVPPTRECYVGPSLRGEDIAGLRVRLGRRFLRLRNVKGDGNCFWYALSAQLSECGFLESNFYHARRRAAFHITEEYLRRITQQSSERHGHIGHAETLSLEVSVYEPESCTVVAYIEYLKETQGYERATEGGDDDAQVAEIFGIRGDIAGFARHLREHSFPALAEYTVALRFGITASTPVATEATRTVASYIRELQYKCLKNREWVESLYQIQAAADAFDVQITIWSVQDETPKEYWPLSGNFRPDDATRVVLARSTQHYQIVEKVPLAERAGAKAGAGAGAEAGEALWAVPFDCDLHLAADKPDAETLRPQLLFWRDAEGREDALNFAAHDRYPLGRTPLIVAVEAGNVEGVQVLVDTPGVDVNQADMVRLFPLSVF